MSATELAKVNGIHIEYKVEGNLNGPVLVFSNSLLAELMIWDKQVKALSDKYKIVRYNHRGHGRTSVVPLGGTIDWKILADDVIALLDYLKISKVHAFIGVSMGGATALALGIHYSSRFERIFVCDISWKSAPGGEIALEERAKLAREDKPALVNATLNRWFSKQFQDANPEVVEQIRQNALNTPTDGFILCLTSLKNYDMSEDAKTKIKTKVYLVCGENDANFVGAQEEMKLGIPGAEYISIPDAGHLPNVEQASVFTSVLEKRL